MKIKAAKANGPWGYAGRDRGRYPRKGRCFKKKRREKKKAGLVRGVERGRGVPKADKKKLCCFHQVFATVVSRRGRREKMGGRRKKGKNGRRGEGGGNEDQKAGRLRVTYFHVNGGIGEKKGACDARKGKGSVKGVRRRGSTVDEWGGSWRSILPPCVAGPWVASPMAGNETNGSVGKNRHKEKV